MRQSRAPNVCAKPVGHGGVVVQRLAGQHPHPDPIHRPRRPDPKELGQVSVSWRFRVRSAAFIAVDHRQR